MSNPIITNDALVSRYQQLSATSHALIDGASITADGKLPRGTIIVKAAGDAKWHVAQSGETLTAGLVRILSDEYRVLAGKDQSVAAYIEGFFKLSAIVGANHSGIAADLLPAAGFYMIESDEVRLK